MQSFPAFWHDFLQVYIQHCAAYSHLNPIRLVPLPAKKRRTLVKKERALLCFCIHSLNTDAQILCPSPEDPDRSAPANGSTSALRPAVTSGTTSKMPACCRSEAQKAIDKLDGWGYDNLILRVEWAQPRAERQ